MFINLVRAHRKSSEQSVDIYRAVITRFMEAHDSVLTGHDVDVFSMSIEPKTFEYIAAWTKRTLGFAITLIDLGNADDIFLRGIEFEENAALTKFLLENNLT